MIRGWVATLTLGIAAMAATPQESGKLTFDAATVKAQADAVSSGVPGNMPPAAAVRLAMVQFRPLVTGGPDTTDPGRISYVNARLNLLLRDAYGLRLSQIAGPDWIETNRFDVTAKIPPRTTREQFREMLRNLLTERFEMSVHRERRNGPIYTLVMKKGGVTLSEANGSGEASMKQAAVDLATIRRAPHDPYVEYKLTCTNMTMVELAAHLGVEFGSDSIDRPVIDGTGLTGRYNFDLKWASETGASFFRADNVVKALEKQLGLMLESLKGPMDVLVVDKASEIPAAN
jgi:uncharacterized protein (TIGR03435 family)